MLIDAPSINKKNHSKILKHRLGIKPDRVNRTNRHGALASHHPANALPQRNPSIFTSPA
jgi:hypothetical protein